MKPLFLSRPRDPRRSRRPCLRRQPTKPTSAFSLHDETQATKKPSFRRSLRFMSVWNSIFSSEEDAVRSDEVRAEGSLLGVPSEPLHRSCHAPHTPRQGSPSRLQALISIFN